MAKRNLRILKRVKNVPVLAECEACKVQFVSDHHQQVGSGQAFIQQQFNAHRCKLEAAKEAAV
jgi:hypothetical protein